MVSDDEQDEDDNCGFKVKSSTSPNADATEEEQFESLMNLGVNTSSQKEGDDEWEDDDDSGYMLITISTEEFFEMEEAFAGRMVYEEELKQETDTWVKETGKQTVHNSNDSHQDDFTIPFTARSVDSQYAANEFTHHYEGMYDDLQVVKKTLDESKSSLSVSVDTLANSKHVSLNGKEADNPYASIRYDKKVYTFY